MGPEDKRLGMGRNITRRDFLEGSLVLASGLAMPASVAGNNTRSRAGMAGPPRTNPSAQTGLRGSHDGAFEVAHDLAWNLRRDWGSASTTDTTDYDLVVVGAGISGLSAAYFYAQANPAARILILDNHDDFGGHAKRNEFAFGERTMLGYGGSQSLEAPSAYSDVATGLLNKLRVDLPQLKGSYDEDFYRRHSLASSIYFDRETYGQSKLVRSQFMDASLFLPLADSKVSAMDAVAQMPLPEKARVELRALLALDEDRLPAHSIFGEPAYLSTISYDRLLTEHLGITSAEVQHLLRNMTNSYFGFGTDMVDSLSALGMGLPGLGGTSLGTFETVIRKLLAMATEPYMYHFPDGNASVARLLVRALIPGVAPGNTMADVVSAPFDYSRLDHIDSLVRLRLNSTVVNVTHEGKAPGMVPVNITYVKQGVTEQVKAKNVVLACYNMAIPHLCPELPATQKSALARLVKTPLVYTNVMLRNWEPFRQLGVGLTYAPGCWFKLAMLDFPVSMDGYRFASSPADPIMLHMNRSVTGDGATPEEQSRLGRYELLGKTFASFERDVRAQLTGMLEGADFDPARDIEAITVNRWPHGYAWSPNALFDQPGDAPHEIGRKRFGRIAIANSDAGARAYLDCAIDEAHRAVSELLST